MAIFNSNVWKGQEARDALRRGVSVVAEAVAPTLGSAGVNAVLEEQTYPGHIVTNDGISIAQKVLLEHPVEKIGANIMKEVADRANKESGDGTTTAMVLTDAILENGQFEQNISPMDLKRSLDECVPFVEAVIDAATREVDVNDIATVATVSAEDESIGEMIQEVYKEIGKDGVIELDVSGTFATSWKATDGVRLRNCGYLAPYMANQGSRAVLEDPKIMICKQRIATVNDLDSLFKDASQSGINEIVMFVDDIDPSVVGALAYTHANGIFKTLVIKAPTLWKDWLFEDFAAITGATIISPATGVTLKTASVKHLGSCERIVTTREETIVTGIKDISEHIKHIEEEGTDDSKLRLAWLKTRAAVIKLGAQSESELAYKRLKAEDARNAAYLALKYGSVPGGGVTLFEASETMPDTPGGRVLRAALKAPLLQIAKNAGEADRESLKLQLINKDQSGYGYNSKTKEICHMRDAGVVDPAQVVKNSFKNALSVAGTVLTSDVVITTPTPKN